MNTVKIFYHRFVCNRVVHHFLIVTHEVMVAIAVEERGRILLMSGAIVASMLFIMVAASIGKDF